MGDIWVTKESPSSYFATSGGSYVEGNFDLREHSAMSKEGLLALGEERRVVSG